MKRRSLRLLRFPWGMSIVAAMLVLSLPPVAATQEPDKLGAQAAPESIPSPPVGGPRPTIALEPDHGYMGQSVSVSGQGVEPYPGVRVTWLTGDATQTAAVVDVDPSHHYSTVLTVPEDMDPGPVQICAAVTGAPWAEFSCVGFTVDQAPPGSVSGQIPLDGTAASQGAASAQAIAAAFVMLDSSGQMAYSTEVRQDGTFDIPAVDPGSYEAHIVGYVPVVVESETFSVQPGAGWVIPFNRIVGTSCPDGPDVAVTALRADLNGLGNQGFGIYIRSGPPVTVTFEALLEGDLPSIERVDFYVSSWVASTRTPIGSDMNAEDGWRISYDVSGLPDWPDPRLVAEPVLSSGCAERLSRQIMAIGNPMDSPYVAAGSLSWNGGHNPPRYDFAGTIPSTSELPLLWPDPPPEVWGIGELENSLDASITLVGSLELNGDVAMRVFEGHTVARLLGIDAHDTRENLAGVQYYPETVFHAPLSTNVAYRTGTRIPFVRGDKDYDIHKSIKILDVPVVGIPLLAEISFSLKVGVHGRLVFWGDYQPWTARLDASLMPMVGPHLVLTVKGTLLFFFSVGVDAEPGLDIGLPVMIDTDEAPPVWIDVSDNPLDALCMYAYLKAAVWTEAFWSRDVIWEDILIDGDWPDGCYPETAACAPAQADPAPRVMASPAVASGPGGRMLSVYVKDTTPAEPTRTLQIMARFWDDQAGAWDAPAALTDGSRLVSDPAAAFVGSGGNAVVAWSQNTLSQEEDPGSDLVTMMAHQEIYYAFWNGSAWSTPIRLTNNAVPDGFPALAGDGLGVTLVWVRDDDGDFTTRTDWHIKIVNWNSTMQGWGPSQGLDATAAYTGLAASPGKAGADLGGDGPVHVNQPVAMASASVPGGSPAEITVCLAGEPYCDYGDIQSAVDAADLGDTIKVSVGHYTGVHSREGVTQTVYISKTVTIQGGYPDPTHPSPPLSTTLDAQGQGRVLYITGEISPTIEGLHITGGDASGLGGGESGKDAGGGVYIHQASATINRSQILSNTADSGGGLYLYGSKATISGNTIAFNAADGGGGLYLSSSQSTISGNTIATNAANAGGGLLLYLSGGTLSGNTIISNTAGGGGGLALNASQPWLKDNVISHNVAENGGGLLFFSFGGMERQSAAPAGSFPFSDNNVVVDNRASARGSGIYIYQYSSDLPFLPMWHTTIARNTGGDGSGIYAECFNTLKLTNTVVVDQAVGVVASISGAALDGVLWHGNTANTSGDVAVTGAYTGTPAFAADGYHLTAASAAIDHGVSTAVTDDIDGDARPQGTAPDLGADEYVGGTEPGVMNAEVSVARKDGLVALAWTVDGDGDLSTNEDRRIATAFCWEGLCSAAVPAALPAGAESPSVALPSLTRAQIAFLVRGDVAGGTPNTGLGNQAVLWTAEYANRDGVYGWEVAPVLDELGQPVCAEGPRLSSNGASETLLAYRRFGEATTNAYLGQISLSQVGSHAQASLPLYLTDEPVQHWQPVLAINQATNQAMLLDASIAAVTASNAGAQSTLTELGPASNTARITASPATLNQGSEPVGSYVVEYGPDPALDPMLALSQQHAAPGSSIIVTATVRNVGREPASGLAVSLYAGTPLTGTLLASSAVPESLGLNASQPVTFTVTAGSGEQPLSALVTTTGDDLNPENNRASGDLSEMPPPTQVAVATSTRYLRAFDIWWMPPPVEAVAGYRILRSETPGGPYELVGEAEGTTYTDLLLKRDQPYYYVVQAFDDAGVRSPYSAEASGMLPPYWVYLPLVTHNP